MATDDGYPTEEELKAIAEWHWDDFVGLAEFVCNIWHFNDWAELRELTSDDFNHEYRELRLATAGWSGNEDIIRALNKNTMFNMLCWQSSHRGGLHIYHVRNVPKKE